MRTFDGMQLAIRDRAMVPANPNAIRGARAPLLFPARLADPLLQPARRGPGPLASDIIALRAMASVLGVDECVDMGTRRASVFRRSRTASPPSATPSTSLGSFSGFDVDSKAVFEANVEGAGGVPGQAPHQRVSGPLTLRYGLGPPATYAEIVGRIPWQPLGNRSRISSRMHSHRSGAARRDGSGRG